MKKHNLRVLTLICIIACTLTAGCVERTLTINTTPQGALVILNDEELGLSPVTTSFNWYGDYNVRLTKEGFETLKTHRELKGPWYDHFPFDFFAQILSSDRIVDRYEWTFELDQKKSAEPEQLIKDAQKLKAELE